VFHRLTLALVIAAITAVMLVSTLEVSLPSVSPFISLHPRAAPPASVPRTVQCTKGSIGNTTITVTDGAVPLGSIDSTSLAQAQRDLAFSYGEGGRTTYTVPSPIVADFNGDGMIDCAIITITIDIRYIEWSNVDQPSDCVRDEWLFYRHNLIVDHEHQHRDDIRTVWNNAHLKFVGTQNNQASINTILDQLVKQEEALANQTDLNKPQLSRCCADATYNNQTGGCECNAADATYNEQNNGCHCIDTSREICNDQCVDPNMAYQSDPKNCGACGNVCPSTAPECSNGQCVQCIQRNQSSDCARSSNSYNVCSIQNTCGPCTSDSQCNSGDYCEGTSGLCCPGDTYCTSSGCNNHKFTTCLGSGITCIDVSNNFDHCGSCGGHCAGVGCRTPDGRIVPCTACVNAIKRN
jgi:hypothetical protein